MRTGSAACADAAKHKRPAKESAFIPKNRDNCISYSLVATEMKGLRPAEPGRGISLRFPVASCLEGQSSIQPGRESLNPHLRQLNNQKARSAWRPATNGAPERRSRRLGYRPGPPNTGHRKTSISELTNAASVCRYNSKNSY